MKRSLVMIIFMIIWQQALSQFGNTTRHDSVSSSAISLQTLSDFLQANVTAGASNGYELKATRFAIKQLGTRDSLSASPIYLKNHAARNQELKLGLYNNSEDRFGLLITGFKYAVINNRDASEYNFYGGRYQFLVDLAENARDAARQTYEKEIANDPEEIEDFHSADQRYQTTQKISEYPARYLALCNIVIQKEIKAAKDSLKKIGSKMPTQWKSVKDYASLENQIDQELARKTGVTNSKALLVVSVNPAFDFNHSRFDSSAIIIEYFHGFGNPITPWAFDLKGSQLFKQDSLNKNHSLNRSILALSIGITKVIVNTAKKDPLLELTLAYEHDIVEHSLYISESRDQPSYSGTLTFHLSKGIAIPFTIKYDKEKANFFGFLRVQLDFSVKK